MQPGVRAPPFVMYHSWIAAVPARTRMSDAMPVTKIARGRGAVGPRTSGGVSGSMIALRSRVVVMVPPANEKGPHPPAGMRALRDSSTLLAAAARVLRGHRHAGEVLLEDRLVGPIRDDRGQGAVDGRQDVGVVLPD